MTGGVDAFTAHTNGPVQAIAVGSDTVLAGGLLTSIGGPLRHHLAAIMAGFRTKDVITRFLPYTTKSRMPQHPLLVRAYLRVPLAWALLGKQTLYLGEKPA